jgi:uncharacterized protein YggE
MKFFARNCQATLLLGSLLGGNLFGQSAGNALYKVQQQQEALTPPMQAPAGGMGQGERRMPAPQQAGFADKEAIVIGAQVLINVRPSAQMAVFNVIQIGESATQANELIEKRIQGLIAGLAGMGIAREKIFVDMVSQAPIFETETTRKFFSKNFLEVPKGFELQKNIHILFERGEQLDQILKLAADQEIYDIIKVDYFVENAEAHYDTLRTAALRVLGKKRALAEQAGVGLDSVFHLIAEDARAFYPAQLYKSYQTFGASSIEAVAKRTGVTQVQKSNTLYYQPLSYAQFDAVIHPVVLEPVVQYTYQIEVRYQIRKAAPKPAADREYFWLTPQGGVQPVRP